MMKFDLRVSVAAIAVVLGTGAGVVGAAQGAAPDVVRVAEGWALLGRGDAAAAEAVAAQVLGEYPQSSAAGALLVQAATARAGATAGLSAYEHWLGTRKIDDAYLLRQVALAYVREVARDTAGLPDARQEALRALSADRDLPTLAAIGQEARSGGIVELQIMAELGSSTAVERLVQEMQRAPGSKARHLQALVASRSTSAAPAIEALLADPLPENRAEAADALGRLDIRTAAPKIRPLLSEPMPYVKLKAAGALYRLGDTTGLPLLRQMEVSEHAMVRADALEATAVSPDSGWQAAVRDLLRESDPSVRLKAAKLLAPHDLQSSAIALEGLLTDSNLAMREAAGAAFVGQVASDFGVLRRFLKTGDQLTRVRAAARILDLTR
jgi:hypothetical protein